MADIPAKSLFFADFPKKCLETGELGRTGFIQKCILVARSNAAV